MTPFWILGAALLVLASLALIVPLWRGEGRQSISRSALNKQLYRQRLLEIGEEREQGILAEEPESLVELQRSLLDDIPDVEQTARGGKSLIWIPGVLVLAVVSIGLYAKLGAWQEVSRWQDASSRLGELSNRILVERDTRVTEQDLLDFTLALRTRLKEEPNDYRGWLLLGRLTLDGNDPEMAREALERAYALAPQKAMVAVPYAQALMMTGEEARADQLLQAVITEDPANIEARSVHAFMALQKEDFQTALDRWQGMLPLLEPGSARYTMVDVCRRPGTSRGAGGERGGVPPAHHPGAGHQDAGRCPSVRLCGDPQRSAHAHRGQAHCWPASPAHPLPGGRGCHDGGEQAGGPCRAAVQGAPLPGRQRHEQGRRL